MLYKQICSIIKKALREENYKPNFVFSTGVEEAAIYLGALLPALSCSQPESDDAGVLHSFIRLTNSQPIAFAISDSYLALLRMGFTLPLMLPSKR